MVLVAITLLFTITAALVLGIFAGYWALNAIFFTFHHRPQPATQPTAAPLAASTQTGD